jgi:hypothetical protein
MKNQKATALGIYLSDHIAGSIQAVELIENICDHNPNEELGRFASQLLSEVKSDQQTLMQIAEAIGYGGSSLKNTTAWIAEKLTLIKLHRKSNEGLGAIEALEVLQLGIHGKWALWCALAEIAPAYPQISGIDFQELAQRAESQKSSVELHRLKVIREILTRSLRSDAA